MNFREFLKKKKATLDEEVDYEKVSKITKKFDPKREELIEEINTVTNNEYDVDFLRNQSLESLQFGLNKIYRWTAERNEEIENAKKEKRDIQSKYKTKFPTALGWVKNKRSDIFMNQVNATLEKAKATRGHGVLPTAKEMEESTPYFIGRETEEEATNLGLNDAGEITLIMDYMAAYNAFDYEDEDILSSIKKEFNLEFDDAKGKVFVKGSQENIDKFINEFDLDEYDYTFEHELDNTSIENIEVEVDEDENQEIYAVKLIDLLLRTMTYIYSNNKELLLEELPWIRKQIKKLFLSNNDYYGEEINAFWEEVYNRGLDKIGSGEVGFNAWFKENKDNLLFLEQIEY